MAELALQGLPAVRQRIREDNARLVGEDQPTMPEATVLKMAEDLMPRLRVADWLDRAEAAQRQLDHLDLRDLRSVVVASDDPVVVRDEATRELTTELKAALVTKQDEELKLWLTDVESAAEVGRVVRALKLSALPPKAGVPFPTALGTKLGELTNAALTPDDPARSLDRRARGCRVLAHPHPRAAERHSRPGQRRSARHRHPTGAVAPAGGGAVRCRGADQGGDAQAVARAAAQEGNGQPAPERGQSPGSGASGGSSEAGKAGGAASAAVARPNASGRDGGASGRGRGAAVEAETPRSSRHASGRGGGASGRGRDAASRWRRQRSRRRRQRSRRRRPSSRRRRQRSRRRRQPSRRRRQRSRRRRQWSRRRRQRSRRRRQRSRRRRPSSRPTRHPSSQRPSPNRSSPIRTSSPPRPRRTRPSRRQLRTP